MADFESAINNIATAQTAKYVARQTEQQTMQTLNQVSAQSNAVYVTPQDIAPDVQTEIARASLDAHLKKAQAAQIDAFAEQQLAETEQADKKDYIGKKVKVTIIDKPFKPVESYWFNDRTGQYDQGNVSFGSVKGLIQDLSFRKNLIVIKPTLRSRIIMPKRKFLFIYVINPETLKPAVDLALV